MNEKCGTAKKPRPEMKSVGKRKSHWLRKDKTQPGNQDT